MEDSFNLFERADATPSVSSSASSKASHAYRTISEVANDLGVATHVLRFWETKFSTIKPVKRAGNRRYYRPQDVEVIKTIQDLLHNQGYTIKGAQAYFKKAAKPMVPQISASSSVNTSALIKELTEIRNLLS